MSRLKSGVATMAVITSPPRCLCFLKPCCVIPEDNGGGGVKVARGSTRCFVTPRNLIACCRIHLVLSQPMCFLAIIGSVWSYPYTFIVGFLSIQADPRIVREPAIGPYPEPSSSDPVWDPFNIILQSSLRSLKWSLHVFLPEFCMHFSSF
jgi:hypothetical protein